MAVEAWSTSTAVFEMLVQNGSCASHFGHEHPNGCRGWHIIHSPVTSFGKGTAAKDLQEWLVNTPLPPTLGPMVAAGCERPMLNGAKVFLGHGKEEVAEVRANGIRHEPASRRLRYMPWPRSTEPAFARCYWLLVHKHDGPVYRIIP